MTRETPNDPTITGRTPRIGFSHRLGPGTCIDQFRLVAEVGAGGMGVVYAAHDTMLDRRVAIKLVHPHRSANGDEQARIVREARAMAKLSHANVIAVHAIRQWRDTYCVVMELVDGVNLGRWLKQRPRDASEIWPIFALAGRGLQAAHEAGLVHRDFKPGNVLVDACGQVKVTDFGLARLLTLDEPAQLAEGSKAHHILPPDVSLIVGTPAYMAPEQFINRGIDARADQFAFCVALFEALYGNRPFAGSTFTQLAVSVRDGVIREPASPDRAPPDVLRVLHQGMAPDPDDRFPNMGELLQALDAAFARCSARAALFAALARAEVAIQTGSIETARGLAEAVIGRAALDEKPEADARARMLLARCAAHESDGEAADRHLRACLRSAAAADDDELMARAWGMLAYVAAFLRGRASEAEGFCLAAEVAALRADDELARNHVLNQVCAVQDFLGHATMVLDMLGKPTPVCDVAAALADLGKLEEADLAARRGLEILERVVGHNHPILSFALDTAASIAMARGQHGRGKLLAERARKIERMTGGLTSE